MATTGAIITAVAVLEMNSSTSAVITDTLPGIVRDSLTGEDFLPARARKGLHGRPSPYCASACIIRAQERMPRRKLSRLYFSFGL